MININKSTYIGFAPLITFILLLSVLIAFNLSSLSVEIVFDSEIDDTGQVYWSVGGEFDENRSTNFAIKSGRHKYTVQVPNGTVKLRIDPSLNPVTIKVCEISMYKIIRLKHWSPKNNFFNWTAENQLESVTIADGCLKGQSTGVDPKLINKNFSLTKKLIFVNAIIILAMLIATFTIKAILRYLAVPIGYLASSINKGYTGIVNFKYKIPKTFYMVKSVVSILLIVLITICILEVSLRIYAKYKPTFIFPSNNLFSFRGQPYAQHYDYNLNSKGFNDVEHDIKKPAGVARIITIGDSFVFGVVPYKYNYYTLLESKLNRNGKKYEIVNMGISSAGPKEYLTLLSSEGLGYNPDIAIVNIFLGNDLLDAIKEDAPAVSNSYVRLYFKFVYKLLMHYRGKKDFLQCLYSDSLPTFDDQKYYEIERYRSVIFLKDNKLPPNYIHTTYYYLGKMKQLCDARKIRLLVILIPGEIQVNKELQNTVANIYNIKADRFDFTLPTRILSKYLDNSSIEYYDLTNEFINKAVSINLYKPKDTHLNLAGNEFAAELLFKYLVR